MVASPACFGRQRRSPAIITTRQLPPTSGPGSEPVAPVRAGLGQAVQGLGGKLHTRLFGIRDDLVDLQRAEARQRPPPNVLWLRGPVRRATTASPRRPSDSSRWSSMRTGCFGCWPSRYPLLTLTAAQAFDDLPAQLAG